jgi:transposase
LEVDEKTVRKYLKQTDFSPTKPVKKEVSSKLDPYKAQILQWLEDDKRTWYKQKHTAKRIHERLKEHDETYDCSYLLVQRFVKKQRELQQSQQQGFLELVWHPGEAQADFGEVECIDSGVRTRNKFFTMSFPYSNIGLTQLFRGESSECVCQGLKDMFHEIGGVPQIIIFDNATGVGRRMGAVVRESKLFASFRAHYGFSIRFCNLNAGHEKGHVENKVGYTRRNWFVPIPEFDDINEYNRGLLKKYREKAAEIHYKKRIRIQALFEEDQNHLLELPASHFDVCRYVYQKANGYGNVRVDGNHFYSTCPEFAGREVLVGIRAQSVDIYRENGDILVSHERRFGSERTDSIDYRTSLAMLMRNAGAWPNSGLREIVPASVREYFDTQERVVLKQALRTMYHLSEQYDIEHAIQAFELAVSQHGQSPLADAAVFAARMAELDLEQASPDEPDLAVYDRFLSAGGRS